MTEDRILSRFCVIESICFMFKKYIIAVILAGTGCQHLDNNFSVQRTDMVKSIIAIAADE